MLMEHQCHLRYITCKLDVCILEGGVDARAGDVLSKALDHSGANGLIDAVHLPTRGAKHVPRLAEYVGILWRRSRRALARRLSHTAHNFLDNRDELCFGLPRVDVSRTARHLLQQMLLLYHTAHLVLGGPLEILHLLTGALYDFACHLEQCRLPLRVPLTHEVVVPTNQGLSASLRVAKRLARIAWSKFGDQIIDERTHSRACRKHGLETRDLFRRQLCAQLFTRRHELVEETDLHGNIRVRGANKVGKQRNTPTASALHRQPNDTESTADVVANPHPIPALIARREQRCTLFIGLKVKLMLLKEGGHEYSLAELLATHAKHELLFTAKAECHVRQKRALPLHDEGSRTCEPSKVGRVVVRIVLVPAF